MKYLVRREHAWWFFLPFFFFDDTNPLHLGAFITYSGAFKSSYKTLSSVVCEIVINGENLKVIFDYDVDRKAVGTLISPSSTVAEASRTLCHLSCRCSWIRSPLVASKM